MKNMKDQGCPSALELFEFINSRLPERQVVDLKKHIDSCARCPETINNLNIYMMQADDNARNMYSEYQVPERISALAKQLATNAFDKVKHVRPKELAHGQLWTTKPMEQVSPEGQVFAQRIVVILNGDDVGDSTSETVVVAPISLEMYYQSQYDLRVFEDESPLCYEFMIEVWNQTTTLVSQLKSYLGPLSETLKEDLRRLNQDYLGLGGELVSLADRIGLPIFGENDPRAIYQVQEVEECAYLREPALRKIALEEKKPVADVIAFPDIWFRKNDESLIYAEVKTLEPIAIAAAPCNVDRNWFLYAKNKVAGEEIVARFAHHLLQGDLRIIFEKLPQILECNQLRVTGYNKSRGNLFSEIITAKKDMSFVVAQYDRVRPEDIEELSFTIVSGD